MEKQLAYFNRKEMNFPSRPVNLILSALLTITLGSCSAPGAVPADDQTAESNQRPAQLAQTKQPPAGIKVTDRIPIFMYHYIRTVDKKKDLMGYDLSVDSETLDSMLKYLADNNYKTIHLADITEGLAPQKSAILSFDDGYEDFYTTAFPLLKKYHETASIAIITGKTGQPDYLTAEQIKELDSNGIEIIAHTVTHPDLNITKDPQSEIFGSRDYLERLLGHKITGFVYPSGLYGPATIKLVKEAGFLTALTTRHGYAELNKDLLQLKRFRIDNRYKLPAFIEDLSGLPVAAI